MSDSRRAGRVLGFAAGLFLLAPVRLLACAVCFGDEDSGLAAGLNAGIAVLLLLGLVIQMMAARFVWRAAKRSRLERDAVPPAREMGA